MGREKSREEIREAIARRIARQSELPDLVNQGRFDLLWIEQDDDGVRRMGDNVFQDPDHDDENRVIVEDPDPGPDDPPRYQCDLQRAWIANLQRQDRDEVLGEDDD